MKVKNLRSLTVQLFDPDGHSLGHVNEYELNDFRLQIRKANAVGFYIQSEGINYSIDCQGNLAHWPEVFNFIIVQLSALVAPEPQNLERYDAFLSKYYGA